MIKRQYKKYKDYNKEENGIKYRKCKECEKWFELNDKNFVRNKNNKDGFVL